MVVVVVVVSYSCADILLLLLLLPDAAKKLDPRLANLCGLMGSPPRRVARDFHLKSLGYIYPPARKPQMQGCMLEL